MFFLLLTLNFAFILLLICLVGSENELSCVRFFVTPWNVACQAPLSMKFSRQEYWSGQLFTSLGDFPNPGIEPKSPTLQVDSSLSALLGKSKNAGVGSVSLLQGIFLTQGLNWGLLHCRWILCHMSHQGSQRILGWVAYPFSRGSSWPRNWTSVSCLQEDLLSTELPGKPLDCPDQKHQQGNTGFQWYIRLNWTELKWPMHHWKDQRGNQ